MTESKQDKKTASLVAPGMQAEIDLRSERVAKAMHGVADAVLLAGNANIYYMSGRFFRGYIYFRPGHEAEYFVVRPLGLEGPHVHYIRKPEQIEGILAELGYALPATLGLELGVLSFNDITRLQSAFSSCRVVDATGVMQHARMVKTPYEQQKMRADGKLQCQAYGRFAAQYEPGMTDVEFQIQLESVLRREGCLGCSRVAGSLMEINMGSVICGDNADAPTPYDFAMGGAGTDPSLPVGADGAVMHPGTTVMVDMNGNFNGYQTDMTRTWAIGEVSELTRRAHDCSRRILRELERLALPGLAVSALYERAVAIAAKEGLERYFMGYTQHAAFIGHGVGIELNEQPPVTARSKVHLEAGMALALEPKFVVPGVGAAGVENTYIVGDDGLECITPFPEELVSL